MTRNTLADLNNHLFAQLERLDDEEMSRDDLETEIDRARAITGVAREIIKNNQLVLTAAKIRNESVDKDFIPRTIIGKLDG